VDQIEAIKGQKLAINTRRLLGVIAVTSVLVGAPLSGADLPDLPTYTDLREPAKLVAYRRQPLLLVVTRNGCSYCELLRQKVLFPMLRSGEINRLALIGELNIDDPETIRNFGGKMTSASEMATAWGVELTPTILFLDQDGRELTHRMVGISNVEFYPQYLEQSIAVATQVLWEQQSDLGSQRRE